MPSARADLSLFASALAARLPGQWTSNYRLHLTFEDQCATIDRLWDRGHVEYIVSQYVLGHEAVLHGPDGQHLYVTDRPLRPRQFVVAPLGPDVEPHHFVGIEEPNGITVPNDPVRAAAHIARRLLPRYESARDAVRRSLVDRPEPPHRKAPPQVDRTLTDPDLVRGRGGRGAVRGRPGGSQGSAVRPRIPVRAPPGRFPPPRLLRRGRPRSTHPGRRAPARRSRDWREPASREAHRHAPAAPTGRGPARTRTARSPRRSRPLTTCTKGSSISTRSFIARPTGTGYEGIYCHYDGYPDHQLPLLLGAARYRFDGDLDALRRHLIDGPHDWKQLGMDLLDRAPDNVRERLDPHGDRGPSAPFDNVFNVDGTPAKPIPVTDANADAMGLEWGYVLHDHGIEVIALTWYDLGPIVPWDTDPLSRISGTPSLWDPTRPAPIQAPSTPLKVTKPVAPAPAPARRRITR